MQTHYAMIRSSRRLVQVERNGPVMWVIHRKTGPDYSVSGPFRVKDDRFRLMPRWWRP